MSVDCIFECSAIEFKILNDLYIVICIYRTPDSNVSLFLSKFEESLHYISDRNPNRIIICGDLNIDILCNDKNKNDLIVLVKSYFILPVFEEVTRLCSGTGLDYIMTNFNNDIYDKDVIHTGLSDHSAQRIAFNVNRENSKFISLRSFSSKNIQKFISK